MGILDLYKDLPEFHKISGQFTIDELNQAARYYNHCQDELLSKYNPTGYLIMILRTGIIEERIKIAKKASAYKRAKHMKLELPIDNLQKRHLCSSLSKLIEETGPYAIMEDDGTNMKYNFRLSLEDEICFLSWQNESHHKYCYSLPLTDKNFTNVIDDWCKKLGLEYNEDVRERFRLLGIQADDTGTADTL